MRSIVITGGSTGIGAATARLAADEGRAVYLTYANNAAAAQAVTADISGKGGQATAIRCDVTDPAQITALFAQIPQSAPIDLVNNAGIVDQAASLNDLTHARLTRMFQTNVIGAILVAQAAVRHMRAAPETGHIVNVSSTAARLGSGGQYIDYAASKGAIDSLTLGLADELAREGIRVNAVRPGLIETPIHAKGGAPDRLSRLSGNVPMGRSGTAEEVARAILWLLSNDASYTTRSTLDVAGGR